MCTQGFGVQSFTLTKIYLIFQSNINFFNFLLFSVIIICSSLNSPETHQLIKQFQNYTNTKILLIDMIGAIFNSNNDFYKFINQFEQSKSINKYQNLLILTILTEKFKKFMNNSLHHFDLTKDIQSENNFNINYNNNRTWNDFNVKQKEDEQQNNYLDGDGVDDFDKGNIEHEQNNKMKRFDKRDSQRIIKDKNLTNRCQLLEEKFEENSTALINITNFFSESRNCDFIIKWCKKFNQSDKNNSKIKFLCEQVLSVDSKFLSKDRRRSINENLTLSTNHVVASEFFILFDYIISIVNTKINQEILFKFDFIVMDFQTVLSKLNETIYVWRPFLILQQNQIHRHVFTTHIILPDYNVWNDEVAKEFWTCGPLCWVIVFVAVFLFICIIMGSIAAGIVVR